MSDALSAAQTRLLRAIAEHVAPERVQEVHLDDPIGVEPVGDRADEAVAGRDREGKTIGGVVHGTATLDRAGVALAVVRATISRST